MSKASDKYYALYGSLLVLIEGEEEDELFLDEFDEVLSRAMLLEMNRRSL